MWCGTMEQINLGGIKLDIYKFIDSKDMREHLRSLDYQFTAAEAAWIVYIAEGNINLEERINTWQEIIDTMPDCVFPVDIPTIGQISTHSFLLEYIAVQRKCMEAFLCSDKNAYYVEVGNKDVRFADFESICKENASKGKGVVVICKEWKGKKSRLDAFVNAKGEVLQMMGLPVAFLDECEAAICEAMLHIENMGFSCIPPFPYEKGDILQEIYCSSGIVVGKVSKNGIVRGYSYYEEKGRIIPGFFRYGGIEDCFSYERCDEEKAERVRRAFKSEIAKMQDIVREWE